MRKLASVQTIWDVEPIDGTDRKSTGWVQPFCKECARRYIHDRYMNANSVLEKREMKSFLQQKFESSMCKDILKDNLFSVQKFSKDSSRIYRYQWKDNWLVKL